MWFLAGLASLLFPGAGQALTGRWAPAAIWAALGILPVLAIPWWPPGFVVAWVVRFAAAFDAARLIRRERPTPRQGVAGAIVVAQLCAMGLIRMFVLEGFVIPASSMTPTLVIGDRIFVDKATGGYGRGDVVVFWHPTGSIWVKRIIAIGGDEVSVRHGVLYVNGAATPRRELGPTRYDDFDEIANAWSQHTAIEYEETLGGHTFHVFHHPDAEDMHDFPQSRDAYFTDARDPCDRRGMMAEMDERTDRRPQMRATPDGTACIVPESTVFLLGDNRDNSNDSREWGVIPGEKIVGRAVVIWWSKGPHGTRWSRFLRWITAAEAAGH